MKHHESTYDVMNAFGDTMTERATSVIAAGAATSPIWLHDLSSTAAVFLPILGVIWLVVQLGTFMWKHWRRKPK